MRSCWLISLVTLLAAVGAAWAHGAQVSARVSGQNVLIEARYSDGGPMSGAAVQVSDGRGKIVHQGTTDEQGRFAFTVVGDPVGLKISARDLLGHRAETTITAADVAS